MQFTKVLCVVSASLAVLSSMPVQAESLHPRLDSAFGLAVGGYWPSIDTMLRVDSTGGIGTSIDMEDDLNLQDRELMPFAALQIRLGERWRIEAEYFMLTRDAGYAIDQDLTIGEVTFPAGTGVTTNFDSDVYRLSVGYSFLKRPAYEMGVALGVHVTSFDLGVHSTGGLLSESADALAPLPTLGFYGQYALSPKWLLTGRGDVFSLEYEEFSGSLVNLNAAVEYQMSQHFGLGLGYRHINLNLDADPTLTEGGSDWGGEFDYTFSGPTLYLSLTF